MSKHTPGPWLLEQTTVYALNDEKIPVNRFTTRIDSGWLSGNQRIHRDEVLANARLIAAAPCLLEALIEVMHVMPALPPAAMLINGMPDRYQAAIKAARAAIARARGES